MVTKAITRECQLSNVMVRKYQAKLDHFEDKYNLTSDDFFEKFNNGELGDNEDFFEWFAYINYYREWKQSWEILQGVERT